MNDAQRKGRLQLIAVAAIFFGPVIAAFGLYYGGIWKPEGQAVNGQLIEPSVALTAFDLTAENGVRLEEIWSLVIIAPGDCPDLCQQVLYETRQLRRALGKNSDRVQRVWLYADGQPDAEFMATQHPGLKTINGNQGPGLGLLQTIDSRESVGLFLVDPKGNLMMQFPAGLSMRGIHTDLKRLLKVSRIG
ncbi:MAG: hypothetical protein ACR2QB_01675 [Gammaproteobacteria bacterium]